MWLRRKRDSRYRTQGTVPALAQSPFQQWISLRSSIGSVSVTAPALATSPLLAFSPVLQQWVRLRSSNGSALLQNWLRHSCRNKFKTPFQQPARCPFQVTSFLKFQNKTQSRFRHGLRHCSLVTVSGVAQGSVPALAQGSVPALGQST
jgi:hypothetical protein